MQVAAILALMLIAFVALRDDFPWPASLTWQEPLERLDSA